jgi:hypothetical protein
MQVVVAGSDLQGFENQFPEVAKIVSDYEDHESAPPLACSCHGLPCTLISCSRQHVCLCAAGVAPPQESKHQSIQTVGGEPLLQFAMTPTPVGEDVYLYEQLIEPELRSGTLLNELSCSAWCKCWPVHMPGGCWPCI